ncbi:MAG: hypothetical protein MR333_05535 [Porphyromonadaceae bacterium]|nr:hypothetical protein [Porphyromonadaceae bacterium]
MNVINFENVENELCRLSAAGHYYSAAPSAADASDVARQPLLTAAESRRYRVYVEQALRVAVAAVRAWLKDLSWTDAGVTFSAPADLTEELISTAAYRVWARILQAAGEREQAEAAAETAQELLANLVARFLPFD